MAVEFFGAANDSEVRLAIHKQEERRSPLDFGAQIFTDGSVVCRSWIALSLSPYLISS
jgi:hypothetical protein